MSLRAPRRLLTAAAVPALVAGVVVAAPAAAAPTAEEPKYRGAAFALQTRVSIGSETILDLQLPDAVVFPSGGEKNLLGLPEELADLATLKVLNASARVENGKFAANSSTTGLSVLKDVVSAKVLNSDCVADQLKLTGDSQIAGVSLMGTKIPIDPGPNFRIEIPKELEFLIAGGITVDEQNKLPGGGLQIRALHIELVIAPDALDAALKSVSEQVRALAEQVVTAVESVTGQSLDSLRGQKDDAKVQADRNGPAKTAASPPAKAAAKAQRAEKIEVAPKAAAAVAQKSAREAAIATDQSAVEAEQSTAQRATITEGAADAESGAVTKADDAAVEREATSEQAETEAALARRAERGAKSTVPADTTPAAASAAQPETAPTQAPDTRADAAAPARTDQVPAAERPAKAEQKAAAAKKIEKPERAASPKSVGAERVADRGAAPAAEDEVKGLLVLDVIVSEVNCVGARLAVKQDPPKRALPKTGGGDMAQDIAVTGLGLLLAGSAAAFVTRRRRHSH